jgi:tripartite-type tricarboxylate transporter receptor subunit TctC
LSPRGSSVVRIGVLHGPARPGGTPRPIIDKLYGEVAAILKQKERRGASPARLSIPRRSSPDEFSARIKADLEKYAKLTKALAAKAE